MENTDKEKMTEAKQREVLLKTVDSNVKAQTVPTPVEVAAPVTFRINGNIVEARPGITLLEAAQSVGIFIPTLCYH